MISPRPAVHRMIARPVGLVLLVVATTLLVTGGVEVMFALLGGDDSDHARLIATVPLFLSAPIGALLGAAGLWWSRPVSRDIALDRGEASVAVTAIWLLLGVVGALPLIFGAGTHPVDAFFEAVSGFTTTGATIYGDIEGTLTPSLVLWRAVMHWLGGMGIVVLFVAIFPNIGVSGKHMFRSEVPAVTTEGLRPRITETSLALYRLYVGLTVLCVLGLWALGMGPHDALVHGFATLSTGGFSSRDASLAAFSSPAIEWFTAVFMLVAGVNFGLYYALVRVRRPRVLWRSAELRVYVGIVVVVTLLLTVSLLDLHGGDVLESLRYSFFRVATSLTSTGFGIDDHKLYPPLAMALTLGMMVVGGCAGSTAGGVKVARVVILFETALAQIRRNVRPAVVHVVKVDRRPINKSVLLEVGSFFFIFVGCLGLFSLAIAVLDGVPVPTAGGAVLSALSNMGPAPFYLEADNYAGYSVPSKLLFSLAMVLGRLEFFTVLSLLLPEVWRR